VTRALVLLVIGALIAGCAGSASPVTAPSATRPSAPTPTPTASPTRSPSPVATSAAPALRVVGLGDSYMSAQDAKGRSFMDVYVAALEQRLGRSVELSLVVSGDETTARLKEQLASDDAVKDAVRKADVIVISVGGNDTDPFGVFPKGTCTPKQPLPACLAAYSPTLADNYETILASIESLRGGKPTAVRVTSMDDPFVGMPEAPGKTFARDFFAQVTEAQTQAVFDVGKRHGARTVDYLHLFSGKDGLADPTRYLADDHAHPGDRGIQAIADLLLALGVPELG
jgi:lysophospholipase L1-like esterase